MCEVFDEVRREGVKEERILIAREMIKDAIFSTKQIARYSHLSLKKVKQLKQELRA